MTYWFLVAKKIRNHSGKYDNDMESSVNNSNLLVSNGKTDKELPLNSGKYNDLEFQVKKSTLLISSRKEDNALPLDTRFFSFWTTLFTLSFTLLLLA